VSKEKKFVETEESTGRCARNGLGWVGILNEEEDKHGQRHE
jgi:hypothetical protein